MSDNSNVAGPSSQAGAGARFSAGALPRFPFRDSDVTPSRTVADSAGGDDWLGGDFGGDDEPPLADPVSFAERVSRQEADEVRAANAAIVLLHGPPCLCRVGSKC